MPPRRGPPTRSSWKPPSSPEGCDLRMLQSALESLLRPRGEGAGRTPYNRGESPTRLPTEDTMANDRGLLPKASRAELDERLARRLERWYDNAYQDDNLFLTMARRPGLLDATWEFIRYIYGG